MRRARCYPHRASLPPDTQLTVAGRAAHVSVPSRRVHGWGAGRPAKGHVSWWRWGKRERERKNKITQVALAPVDLFFFFHPPPSARSAAAAPPTRSSAAAAAASPLAASAKAFNAASTAGEAPNAGA